MQRWKKSFGIFFLIVKYWIHVGPIVQCLLLFHFHQLTTADYRSVYLKLEILIAICRGTTIYEHILGNWNYICHVSVAKLCLFILNLVHTRRCSYVVVFSNLHTTSVEYWLILKMNLPLTVSFSIYRFHLFLYHSWLS